MPRVQPISPACIAYIEGIKPTVQFAEKSYVQTAKNMLFGIGKVALLNAKNACDNEKVARSFEATVSDGQGGEEDLSRELSFLNEAQISVLRLPFTERNLNIVNMAIFQTNLAKKKEALARIAIALKKQEPTAVLDLVKESAAVEAPAPEPEPITVPEIPKAAMREVKTWRTPTERKEHVSSNPACITVGKLLAKEFREHLVVLSGSMPYYNHVKELANLLDHQRGEKGESRVRKLFMALDLTQMLYLYEVMKEHLGLMKEMWVDSYMAMQPTDACTSEQMKNIFRAYLERNKNDRAVNGRYIDLLAAVEEAELKALREAAEAAKKKAS